MTTTEAGAVPSLTRDAGTHPQTGKAEQVWSEEPGSATARDDQSHPTVTRQEDAWPGREASGSGPARDVAGHRTSCSIAQETKCKGSA